MVVGDQNCGGKHLSLPQLLRILHLNLTKTMIQSSNSSTPIPIQLFKRNNDKNLIIFIHFTHHLLEIQLQNQLNCILFTFKKKQQPENNVV